MKSVGKGMKKRYEDYVWKEISKLCQEKEYSDWRRNELEQIDEGKQDKLQN